MPLEFLTTEPTTPANAAIIWLHGLGADGYDFYDIPQQLNLPESIALRFIFPHAPIQPVTLNGGMPMRAWYDLYHLERDSREDETGLREAQSYIEHLIETQLKAGIPAHRIFLAGFSQGGALALFAGLRYPEKLGGILALSTYVPLAKSLASEANSANQSTPILMVHGDQDPILPIEWALESQAYLLELGYKVEWHEYPMGHQLCMPELIDIRQWLVRQLA